MSTLVLLRHGQSLWNAENRFTGWVDVPLSEEGEAQAKKAGSLIKDKGLVIDQVFTSCLIRAQETAVLAVKAQGLVPIMQHTNDAMTERSSFTNGQVAPWIPMWADIRLNERYYGELQGLNKEKTTLEYGKEQVRIWRRSYDVPPPGGESLVQTEARVSECLKQRIEPALLEKERTVLVAAHGNSLRSMIKLLENKTSDEITACEIATGAPRVYQFNQADSSYTHLT